MNMETTLQSEIRKHAKNFRVIPKAQYYRLTHLPSGDYIQRHLCDFLTRKDAIECRNTIITAAPDWDWSDPGLFTDMPSDMSNRVWAAIYANPRREMRNLYAGKPGHVGIHDWTPGCCDAPYCQEVNS